MEVRPELMDNGETFRPGPITVAIDSTGLSPDRPSGWMVEKWDRSRVRGWYKLHVAVDVDAGWSCHTW